MKTALPWTARASVVLAVVVIVSVNLFARRQLPEDPLMRAVYLRRAGLPAQAQDALDQVLALHPLSLEANRFYVINHFDIPPGSSRDDAALEQRYLALASEPASADLAHLCLGLARSLEGRHLQALGHYRQVGNPRLRYLHSAMAASYEALGDSALAEQHYREEINLGDDLIGAVPALARLYLDQGRLDEVTALLGDPQLAPYVNAGIRREAALGTGRWGEYLRIVFLEPLLHIGPGAALSALVICGMWLAYLRRVDLFEQEPLAPLLLALGLGALFAEASLLLTDAVHPALRGPAGWLGELIRSLIGIGLVEEVAKLVPLLLIIALVRLGHEPLDFLIYGSLSALGFATLENALYFSSYGLDIVFSRFIISTVLHVSMTGLVAYAWARARFMRRAPAGPRVVGALLLAALLHGLFDYFLMRGQQLAVVSILIGSGLAVAYGNMIANSLSFSPYFRRSGVRGSRLENLGLLVGTTALLVLIGFLYAHYTFSTEVANLKLVSSAGSTLLSVVVVFGSLGEISVTQGITVPLLRAAWRRR